MTPATAEALRVECAYCGHVLSDGLGMTSHGLCDDEWCASLAERPITRYTVERLFMVAAIRWGRFRNGEITKDEWQRAQTRAETALDLMCGDYGREIRRLKVAAAETTEAA